jgi:AcrR family transcriptional regulator
MTQKPKDMEDTREKLIAAAKRVFAEKGYAGATVKEIADQAGVNISLISYHFNGKEGLLRACVEQFGRERLQESQNIFTPPESVEDVKAKLRLWCTIFLRCHVEDKNVCSILNREKVSVSAENPLWEVFESTFLKAFDSMVKFLESARKKGFIKKEIDPTMAAAMMYGSLAHLGTSQDVQQKILGTSIANEKFRQQAIEQFSNILLNGIT